MIVMGVLFNIEILLFQRLQYSAGLARGGHGLAREPARRARPRGLVGLAKYGQACCFSRHVAIIAIIDPCLLSTVLHFECFRFWFIF